MEKEFKKPDKISFHRKLNRINRFIFLFGGIFVAILLAVMYHYANLAQAEKTQINIVILSNDLELKNVTPKIILNDSIILFNDKLLKKQYSITKNHKIAKSNFVSCILNDSLISKSEDFILPEICNTIQITCSFKETDNIISADIFYSPVE